ncbi:MAG: ABC transporter permease [Bacteroidales bacterium]
MKAFWGFVHKEFLHIFRDLRTLLVLFGIPVVQILLFGYVVSTDLKKIPVAVLDQSKDELSRQLTDKIFASGFFVPYRSLNSQEEVEEAFREGWVREVVIFEPGFAEKLERERTASVHLIADASDANTANLIVNYTQSIIAGFEQNLNITQGNRMAIEPRVRMLFNERLESVYMFVPGTMALILMLISAMMTSISIAREKEMGTMEVLLISPLKPVQIIIGKVLPYVALAFFNAISILILGHFVFGMPVNGSIALLLGESFLYIALALSLGIFISTVANSQQVAMFMSLFALMLPTILLSGFIFPIENMPLVLQAISSLLPPRYFIVIVKSIMLKGTGLAFIWKETLILVAMMTLFILMSIKKFKIRLD